MILLSLVTSAALAGSSVSVKNLRMWQAPDHTRLVFDLSREVSHELFTLEGPHRIVVDLRGAALSGGLPELDFSGPYLRGIRHGTPKPGTLRIVLDLKRKVQPRTFVLKPNELYGHRLVIDLYDEAQARKAAIRPPKAKDRKLVIAIDAGHGGEDPGALGRRGTREKDITLAVASALKRYIDRDPDMKAVMVRTGDYYVSLRRRTAIARSRQADLFVSIHADAYPKRSVRGSSVYALSRRGASSEAARWLADKENAADLIGGVSLRDKEDLLAKVLWDLSMTKTISDSLELGQDVLSELRRVGSLHRTGVEQAGFAVLKSPDVPSLLVETAFISNPKEEKQLRSQRHRDKIAAAIYRGIRRYHDRKRPHTGVREYVVRKGDSLSMIALRYRVSIAALKRANNLRGDVVRIGQRLKIPRSGDRS
jgi:N-acetylmuramoyl-L-alanine amidase